MIIIEKKMVFYWNTSENNKNGCMYNLKCKQIDNNGAFTLSEVLRFDDFIESLDLSDDNKITHEGIQAIINQLFTNRSLKFLDLSLNYIDNEDMKLLFNFLKKNKNLKTLQLRGCVPLLRLVVGQNFYKELYEALKENTSLLILNLAQNGFRDEICTFISESLKVNTSLRDLKLYNNYIGKDGAQSLIESLKINNSIQFICLGRNNIGNDGIKNLHELISINKTLQHINLSENIIDGNGVNLFFKSLKHNKTLKSIFLSHNNINGESLCKLSESLMVNTSIEIISLSFNPLGDVGIFFLSKSLRTNRYIKYLYIKETDLHKKGRRSILETLKINKYIQLIDLDDVDVNKRNIIKMIREEITVNRNPEINKTEIDKKMKNYNLWNQIKFHNDNQSLFLNLFKKKIFFILLFITKRKQEYNENIFSIDNLIDIFHYVIKFDSLK